MKKTKLLSLLALGIITASLFGGQPPKMNMPPFTKAPVIDGNVTPEEYRESSGFYGFNKLYPKEMIQADAWCYAGTDGKKLYLAYRTEIGPNGLLAKVVPDETRSVQAGADDSVEVILASNPSDKASPLYQFILNSRGALFSQSFINGKFKVWRPVMEQKSGIHDRFWHLELAIDLACIGIEDWTPETPVGIRICRNWFRIGERGERFQTSWNQISGAFFTTSNLPLIRWSKKSPAVQFFQLRKDHTSTEPDIKISIENTTPEAMTLNVHYKHQPVTSKNLFKDWKLNLNPGEKQILDLPVADLADNEMITSFVQVTSADDKEVFFERDISWKAKRVEPVFLPKRENGESAAVFKYAYYPSHKTMRIFMDANTLPDAGSCTGITAAIALPDGNKLAEKQFKLNDKKVLDEIWETPDLRSVTIKKNKSGKYILTVTLDGAKTKPIIRTFEHQVFEWENNNIGKTTKILPPFTPIKIEGMNLSTVLRKHTIGPDGLWKQVNADGHELLAEGGIRLETEGKIFEGKDFTFTEKANHRAAAKASLVCGEKKADVFTEYDYDGMMTWKLTLQPGKYKDLSLIIPVKASEAPLFHAVSDSLRINYGGKTPDKWDSTEALRYHLLDSFCSYIWLGSEGPGLSVFADNDANWNVAAGKPTQTLLKKGDTAELICHLFGKETIVEKPLTITLNFEATPVKPMPENWRLLDGWNYDPQLFPFIKYHPCFMGTGSCYATELPCAELYPLHRDLIIWDKMAAYKDFCRTHEPGTPERIAYEKEQDKFIQAYALKFPEHRKKIMVNQIRYGFGTLRFSDQVKFRSLVYTNARGCRLDDEEGRTFLDQWTGDEFRGERNENGKSSDTDYYTLCPDEAYADYAAWWYQRMCSRFCDDLYWDNICPAPARNLTPGNGVRMADGRVNPGVNLSGVRRLVKRGALTIFEIGRLPFNMVHMTNTNMAPTEAFAQQNLNWEDHSGVTPFQVRYSREYLRAVSLGYQSGNLSCGLGLVVKGGDKNELLVCQRSGTGVSLTHEVIWLDNPKFYRDLRRIQYEFGYGKPEVKVWNYWQKDYPLTTPGKETSSILMTRNDGEILMVICNYDKAGDFTVKLDKKAVSWKDGAKAYNMEDGSELAFKDGTLTFSMPQYDFRMIHIK